MTHRPRITFYATDAVARWLSSECERTGERHGEVCNRILLAESENGLTGYGVHLQGAVDRGEAVVPGMKAGKSNV